MPLPDIPVQDWQQYEADDFARGADNRIGSLDFTMATNQRIGQLDTLMPQAPASSDSLTNPLGTGNAGPTTDTSPPPPTSPSPAPDVSAPAFPTPDAPPQLTPPPSAPPTLDFGASAPSPIAAREDAASPSPSASGATMSSSSGSFTDTTAGLSGGGQAAASGLSGDAPFILSAGGQIASWLGSDGQKAVQSVLVTEGGMNKARGDSGMSAGPFQFYEKGQLANYARARGVSLDQAKQMAEAQPLDAVQWAIGTPDQPGYLGAAVQRGQAMGLRGADLATYAQRTGQVSVSPERAGKNYDALFSNGQDPYQVDTSARTGMSGSYTPGIGEGLERVGAGVSRQQSDISQFGDPQLTSEEAYAACGPAAAVRFAGRFGRNPTLKEALDMAKSVGWTAQQGMAGLGSEKALMDRIGVPTRLVNGAQWDVFAKEAQTGNPVTISTVGHYFTADGYNPDTGAFHVGRSGLDLKGGSEWMTAAQMQNLMGNVQGGLLADNPQVPQPSTADQSSSPMDWLGRQKDALASGIGGFFSGMGDAASAITSPPRGQPMTAAEQPTPSDSLTNPTRQPNPTTPPVGSLTPPPNGGPTIFDQAGQTASDLYGALPQGSILKGGLNASNAAVPATDLSTATMRPGGALALQAESDFQRQRAGEDQEVNTLGAKIKSGTATPEEQQRFYEIGLNQAMAFGTNAPESPAITRMFHGTGFDFSRPDAARFNANGLYGPGYYLTTDARVAASYAESAATDTQAIQRNINAFQRAVADPKQADYLDMNQRSLDHWQQQLANVTGGANVRAVDAPNGLDLFDVERPVSAQDGSAILNALNRQIKDPRSSTPSDGFLQWLDEGKRSLGKLSGDDLYHELEGYIGNATGGRPGDVGGVVNRVLADAGFDGVSYAGGRRIPLRDASGAAIEHNVSVIFPESLDKLRNGISGTQGGQITPGFASTLGGAAAGGGSTYAATDPNDPNRGLKVTGGALAGGLAGYGAARALTRAPAATGSTYQSVMPAGAFEAPTSSSSATGLNDVLANVSRVLTRAFTDRQVDVNQVQQAYQRALGRPLNANEMASELQRLNPHAAAAVKVDEGLRPAIQSVGDDYDALRDYVTLRSNVQVADALGNDARLFSGGLTQADSQARLSQLEQQLGPERFQTVQQAADQVSAFSKDLRQRLVDSSVLNADQAAQMDAMYPDWAKTRILDYMKDPAGGQASGSKIGLADRQLRQYSVEGTTKAREDPIASTVAYAHQVETMANKNEAFNAMLTLDRASPSPQLRKVAQDFSPTKDQVTMVGFENGQKVKYVTDNKALGEAINGTSIMSVPQWTSAWQRVFRSLATSRNPVFLAGNAALDIPTYTFRTAIRDGGPQALPGIMADLARGYADAFQGVLQGEFRGSSTASFLKGGGGQSGGYVRGVAEAAQSVADLRRSNVFQISSKADLLRLAKDVVTLKPVEGLGERVELGPRVAAYNRALKRGANPVQAVNEGRTVTVDFSQGGTVTKYLNNFIPFLNVGFQGPAQLARAYRDNPLGFVATAGTLIGLPSVAAETWNHADPQRWKDYQDVPDYVKNQGVVVMLPGDVSGDAQGNRKPAYAVIKLREWAPFAQVARAAVDTALGDNQRSWQEMTQSIVGGLSPTNASSISQIGAEPLAGVPVLPAALQLQQNRDFFRNRDIVTNRNDQTASAAAQALTPVIQSALDRAGVTGVEVRPSAIDFLIRDQGAGVGSAVLGASDLAAGKPRQDQTTSSLPVAGGLIGRFSGSQTGQGLQAARDVGLTQSAREILRTNGITSTPGPVGSTINQIPIKLDEEARYQRLANRYVDDAIHRAAASSDFARMSPEGKKSLMQGAIDAAKGKAGLEVLSTIPDAEKRRRLTAKTTGASAPVGAGARP